MTYKKFYASCLTAAALAALPLGASAGLVYNAALKAPAQGFGNAPRDLTLQATGQTSFESGAVNYLGASGIDFGVPIADSAVHDGNGITNAAVTTASQIGVLFNATEPGGDSINVLDVTLKFYTAAGLLLGAIDGQQNFAFSNPGNGVAGFTFVVSGDEQSFVDGLLAIGGAGTTFALEASIGDFAGGPESFLIYNLGVGTTPPVPEPGTYALMLGGLGAMGWVMRRRRTPQA